MWIKRLEDVEDDEEDGYLRLDIMFFYFILFIWRIGSIGVFVFKVMKVVVGNNCYLVDGD